MQIKNHRLRKDQNDSIRFEATINKRTSILDQKFLVIHYTAGASLNSTVAWFKNPSAQASAHIVIGRDGEVVQMVPFNQIAWHAGRSSWNGINGLNNHSIGIELDNGGRLKGGPGMWFTWFNVLIDDQEVLEETHRNEILQGAWHKFPKAQIDALIEVAIAIVRKYNIKEVLGHDDIAPHRKSDPGPAFPMASFRSKVLGRADSTSMILQTAADLNIRYGPGAEYDRLPESPLPKDTRVDVLSSQASWRFVDVLDPVNMVAGLQGWVHGNYLVEV